MPDGETRKRTEQAFEIHITLLQPLFARWEQTFYSERFLKVIWADLFARGAEMVHGLPVTCTWKSVKVPTTNDSVRGFPLFSLIWGKTENSERILRRQLERRCTDFVFKNSLCTQADLILSPWFLGTFEILKSGPHNKWMYIYIRGLSKRQNERQEPRPVLLYR